MRLVAPVLIAVGLAGGALAEEKIKPEKKNKSAQTQKYECGKKRYCSQMTSCEEAIFYYKVCGLKRLDRDRDGIPCEKICR